MTATTNKLYGVTIYQYIKKFKEWREMPDVEERYHSETEAIARMSEPLPKGQQWGAYIYTPKGDGAMYMSCAEVRDGHLVPVW
jgi:hypothetical protein